MIKSITLSNFFSFAEKQTVELDPYVNILIGINGSGKSNFIKAIELLSRGIEEGGMNEVVKEWWDWGNVKNHKFHNDKIPIELIFTFGGEKTFDTFPEYKKSDWTYHLKPLSYEDNEGNGIPTSETINFNIEEKPLSFDLKSTFADRRLFTHHLTFKHKAIGKLRSQIEEIVVYNDIDVTSIRKKAANYRKNDTRLNPSIENFAGLLYHLYIHYPEYDKIKELLREVNPYFKDISFIADGLDSIQITMEEGGLPLEVVIQHISTGTLKFLALLAILYNPNRGKVVCLEEPEQGLHPDMINTIAKGIKHAARTGTQMIVATHSPILLDSFLVDDMLVFEKDKNNETRVTRKIEEDYENWVNDYSTGDLWMSGKMGGVK